ncbi:MAG TPA: complex I subunit 1 family protein [Planctomycetota bacterium]|nr:complex I subunit 1 family protein [Planctomycetota bacterium]
MPPLYDLLVTHLGPTCAALTAVVVPCLVVFLAIQAVAGLSTYVERKIAADIQRRVGPNKCNTNAFLGEFARQWIERTKEDKRGGIWGLASKIVALLLKPAVPLFKFLDKVLPPGILIFLADGIKLIMKEDIIPDPVDKPMFKLAPTIVLAASFGALATLPYSDNWYVADFNTGLLFIAAVTSIEVLGILMAGWASNNKWALLGGMRSAAQIVSYELPVGLAILTGIVISGTLSMQGMTYDQFGFAPGGGSLSSGWFWQWNLFHPAMFILAPVYFLAALAECNRTPFDIPEAESELVSGYHTEYCGMRFAFFFMGEYAMMCVTSAIAVTLFLGGWSTGIAPLEHLLMSKPAILDANGIMTGMPEFAWYGTLLHLIVFVTKTYFLVFIMMWIRWTLPRFRVDQMMTLCWKKLIPLSLACLTGVCAWQLARMWILAKNYGELLGAATFWLRALFAVGILGYLVWYFTKPLTKAQVDQREMLAKSNLNTGIAM